MRRDYPKTSIRNWGAFFGVRVKRFDTIITIRRRHRTFGCKTNLRLPLFHFGPARDQSILEGLATLW